MRPVRRWTSAYLWHRRLGLAAALFLAWLALSGLALQHADALGLYARWAPPALWPPGFDRAPCRPQVFAAGPHRLIGCGRWFYLDGDAIDRDRGALRGAAMVGSDIAVLTDEALLWYDRHGRRLEAEHLLATLGAAPDRLWVEDGALLAGGPWGRWRWQPDALTWQFEPAPAPPLAPAGADAPAAVLARVQRHERAHRHSWGELLALWHSGRAFGALGARLVDAAALAALALAFTGCLVWWRRRRGRR